MSPDFPQRADPLVSLRVDAARESKQAGMTDKSLTLGDIQSKI